MGRETQKLVRRFEFLRFFPRSRDLFLVIFFSLTSLRYSAAAQLLLHFLSLPFTQAYSERSYEGTTFVGG